MESTSRRNSKDDEGEDVAATGTAEMYRPSIPLIIDRTSSTMKNSCELAGNEPSGVPFAAGRVEDGAVSK